MKDRMSKNPGLYNAEMYAGDVANMNAGKQFHIKLYRDDDPIVDGTPYNKDSVLPDDVVELLGATPLEGDDVTPADAFRSIGTDLRDIRVVVQNAAEKSDLDIVKAGAKTYTDEQIEAVRGDLNELQETVDNLEFLAAVATLLKSKRFKRS